MTVRVAGAAGQRTARVDAPEPLATGERVRIGYQAGAHRYVLSLSVDEHGEVTPLYPEEGASLTVAGRRRQRHALPARQPRADGGRPRADDRRPLATSRSTSRPPAGRPAPPSSGPGAISATCRALDLPGEQFPRTFVKP